MADEIRRSGRATKGQHTKNVEETESQPTKRGKAGRPSKASKQAAIEATPPEEEDEGPAIIRCICGCVEEDEDDERTMVICDKCSAWQHNICMGISEDPDELPEQYFCELCRPKDHKELLAAIVRREKPWEERESQRQREEQEKKGRKRKGGKRGRRGRASESNIEKAQDNNGTHPSPAQTPLPPQHLQASVITSSETGQKRKLPAELDMQATAEEAQEPTAKLRKVSTPKEVILPPQRRKSSAIVPPIRQDSKEVLLQTELVNNISELQSEARQRVASALVKLFVEQTHQAQKQGAFKIPLGQSPEAFGLRLGLAVEYAIYLNFWGHTEEPKPEYKEKLRMMLHNVKANPTLRDRLLAGSLSPNDFSKMSSLDMASKELQEQTEQMIKEAEKQHMLIQEDGPRIRRTHKGDELVGDESQDMGGTESISTTAPARPRDSISDATGSNQIDGAPTSPQSPQAIEVSHDSSLSASATSPVTGRPLTVDTKSAPRNSLGNERKSSSAFNIETVWSSVDTPDGDKQRFRQPPHSRSISNQVTGLGVQVDADIDHLLKDEDPDDEEPYSPTDFESEPGTVWRGSLSMASVAEFRGSGKHVAGANLSSVYPWAQLIPPSLRIEGRIDVEKASQYLCGLQWSKTTDVSVIAITPSENPLDQAQFDKLFTYFTERSRYGVISKSLVSAVRDVYIVPLESGAGKKPEFVELLEYCTLEEPRPTRMLLITYVIKTKIDAPPSAQATPRHVESGIVASPISVHPPTQYRTPSIPHAGAQMSPIGTYGGSSYGSPVPANHSMQQQQPYSPAYNNTTSSNNNMSTSEVPKGMDAARQVLGDMANVPAVGELLSQAPATGVVEFGIIKECFESVPACRGDFNMLMALLTARTQQGPPGVGAAA